MKRSSRRNSNSFKGLTFDGSLRDLVKLVLKRVHHGIDLIGQLEDPEIIQREMRFIRPFWEFFRARQKLNEKAFWLARKRDLFADYQDSYFNKTDLLALPTRGAICHACEQADETQRKQILNIVRGTEIVLFNFLTLCSRCKYVLGIEDDQAFHLTTSESEGAGYTLSWNVLKRPASDDQHYRIITLKFLLPDGEAVRIEKDYSEDNVNPQLTIRFQKDKREPGERLEIFEYTGMQSELKNLRGRLMTRAM